MLLVRLAAVGCCLTVLCSVPGCGGSAAGRSAVQGTVKFDGQPVSQGVIAFIPTGATRGPSTGAEIKAGKYQILADQGPVLGPHRVEITATRAGGATEVKGLGQGGGPSGGGPSGGGPSGGGSAAKIEMYIPEQYNKQSKLEFVIKAGRNEANFDLKSK